ncbi:MAG: HEAT repeat domain-containing protein [Nitrospirae bacterium]|nr:HEAT repeat domain-containing protein [Nitrospirota bacterium]
MFDLKENVPLDTRLLSEAIIELNISRHNVSIYPRNHPIVDTSLNKAFDHLQQLFELRQEITLAIAKDTLIIDMQHLDRQNPVYKDFAACLSGMNIASVTFVQGLTKEELYSFHSFLLKNIPDEFAGDMQEFLAEYNLVNIKIGFIDYSAFIMTGLESGQTDTGESLLEKYVYGLLEGSLDTEDAYDVLFNMPPGQFAELINNAAPDKIREDSYDRIITSYIRRSSERAFSGKKLAKFLGFINDLNPGLKQQFLSSTANAMSRDLTSIEKSLRDMSADDFIELFSIINEYSGSIPEALKNLLDKFSAYQQKPSYGGGLVEDDIFISPEVAALFEKAKFSEFVTDSYQAEIQRILKADTQKASAELTIAFAKEWSDEHIEKDFNRIILELLSSAIPDIIDREDYGLFAGILQEQMVQFINTGQYGQVLKTIRTLGSNADNRLSSVAVQYYNSPQFISSLVDSLRVMGRQMRDDAMLLCDYYDEKVLPPLMDALFVEESPATRKFILSAITHFGYKAADEAVKRLGDKRWFVTRNLLFILLECGNEEALKLAKPFCNHENPKVSFEAIKCLLKAKDEYGITSLRNCLNPESEELIKKALDLAGAFKVKEVVTDLIKMLEKRAMFGADFEKKIPFVRALGQIGDPAALDTLRNILNEKSLFFKNALDRLKEEIKRTLKHYPEESVKDIK